MTRYTTRDEAIAREIIEPIETGNGVESAADEFDVEAIAEAVLADHDGGYASTVDEARFWEIVERYAAYEVDMTDEDQYHLYDQNNDLILDDDGNAGWYTTLSVLEYEGEDLPTGIAVPVSDEWEPEVYREALEAAGWSVVGEIPDRFTSTLRVVRAAD